MGRGVTSASQDITFQCKSPGRWWPMETEKLNWTRGLSRKVGGRARVFSELNKKHSQFYSCLEPGVSRQGEVKGTKQAIVWFLGRLICENSHPLSSKWFVTFILFSKTVCLPGITAGNKRKVRARSSPHCLGRDRQLLFSTIDATVKINSGAQRQVTRFRQEGQGGLPGGGSTWEESMPFRRYCYFRNL